MSHTNIEIKARCSDLARVRRVLQEHNADFRGVDRQVDTYFNCSHGRLKLRQGNIENALIHYDRPDDRGPKQADVTLCPAGEAGDALKAVLTAAVGVKVVVHKSREIYFIDNVKFHIDDVAGLGAFVEIEAIDADNALGLEHIRSQCQCYLAMLGINDRDLVTCSYSDMLLGLTP